MDGVFLHPTPVQTCSIGDHPQLKSSKVRGLMYTGGGANGHFKSVQVVVTWGHPLWTNTHDWNYYFPATSLTDRSNGWQCQLTETLKRKWAHHCVWLRWVIFHMTCVYHNHRAQYHAVITNQSDNLIEHIVTKLDLTLNMRIFTDVLLYRSGTVNSKSFVCKVLLQITWKFELTYAL